MPTRRAFVAASIPAVVVAGIFWRWLGFPVLLAAGIGLAFGFASLMVTRSVYDQAEDELVAWRRAAPDLAELDRDRGARDAEAARAGAESEAEAGSPPSPAEPAGPMIEGVRER
jgi:hypothetical protein